MYKINHINNKYDLKYIGRVNSQELKELMHILELECRLIHKGKLYRKASPQYR